MCILEMTVGWSSIGYQIPRMRTFFGKLSEDFFFVLIGRGWRCPNCIRLRAVVKATTGAFSAVISKFSKFLCSLSFLKTGDSAIEVSMLGIVDGRTPKPIEAIATNSSFLTAYSLASKDVLFASIYGA